MSARSFPKLVSTNKTDSTKTKYRDTSFSLHEVNDSIFIVTRFDLSDITIIIKIKLSVPNQHLWRSGGNAPCILNFSTTCK
jgi:hypothetical protein